MKLKAILTLITLAALAAIQLAAIATPPMLPGDALPLHQQGTWWGLLQVAGGKPHTEALTDGLHWFATWPTAGARAFSFLTGDPARLIQNLEAQVAAPCDATCLRTALLAQGWRIANAADFSAALVVRSIAVVAITPQRALTTVWIMPAELLKQGEPQ